MVETRLFTITFTYYYLYVYLYLAYFLINLFPRSIEKNFHLFELLEIQRTYLLVCYSVPKLNKWIYSLP